MLTPEQLQATFERERRFRSAILDAAKASQPKQPGLLAGLAIFITKTIPPQVVSKAIENAGRSWLESRRAAREADQPQEPKLPAPVRAEAEGDGRSKERYNRSGISFVGTLVEDRAAKLQE